MTWIKVSPCKWLAVSGPKRDYPFDSAKLCNLNDGVLQIINGFLDGWEPTPSAKCLFDIKIQYGGAYKVYNISDRFTIYDGFTCCEQLWPLRTDLEVNLLMMQRNPAMSGTREMHTLWLERQREIAEESGMY